MAFIPHTRNMLDSVSPALVLLWSLLIFLNLACKPPCQAHRQRQKLGKAGLGKNGNTTAKVHSN